MSSHHRPYSNSNSDGNTHPNNRPPVAIYDNRAPTLKREAKSEPGSTGAQQSRRQHHQRQTHQKNTHHNPQSFASHQTTIIDARTSSSSPSSTSLLSDRLDRQHQRDLYYQERRMSRQPNASTSRTSAPTASSQSTTPSSSSATSRASSRGRRPFPSNSFDNPSFHRLPPPPDPPFNATNTSDNNAWTSSSSLHPSERARSWGGSGPSFIRDKERSYNRGDGGGPKNKSHRNGLSSIHHPETFNDPSTDRRTDSHGNNRNNNQFRQPKPPRIDGFKDLKMFDLETFDPESIPVVHYANTVSKANQFIRDLSSG